VAGFGIQLFAAPVLAWSRAVLMSSSAPFFKRLSTVSASWLSQ